MRIASDARKGPTMANRGARSVAAGTAGVALALTAGACGPSQELLDARAKNRELQSQLEQARSDWEQAQSRLDALQQKNNELSNRLQQLGQSLEQVKGERRSLKARMNELKKALDEYRARQERAEDRRQQFCNVMESFRRMIESGQLKVRVVRNRMVVELPEGVLFPSGRARLKEGGKEALGQVGGVLQKVENRDFQVTGHTDNVPINTRRFPSNWELSTQRAVNVTKFLIEEGMKAERVSAAGYAATQPVASNKTEKGRRKNRRIEIVLVPNLDELPDLSTLEQSCD